MNPQQDLYIQVMDQRCQSNGQGARAIMLNSCTCSAQPNCVLSKLGSYGLQHGLRHCTSCAIWPTMAILHSTCQNVLQPSSHSSLDRFRQNGSAVSSRCASNWRHCCNAEGSHGEEHADEYVVRSSSSVAISSTIESSMRGEHPRT